MQFDRYVDAGKSHLREAEECRDAGSLPALGEKQRAGHQHGFCPRTGPRPAPPGTTSGAKRRAEHRSHQGMAFGPFWTPTTPAGFQQAQKAAKPLEIRNPQAFPSAKPQLLQEAAPGDKKGLSTGEPRRKTARTPITGNTTGPHTGVGTSWPSCGGLVPPGTGRSSEG